MGTETLIDGIHSMMTRNIGVWFSLTFLMSATGFPNDVVAQQEPRSRQDQSQAAVEPRIIYGELDKDIVVALRTHLQNGQKQVERFFGQPFKKAFDVEVFTDRAAFDKYFRDRWKVPKTEAWMVASGVADRLAILSPRVWKAEAVEHDPGDAEHIRELIAHELVHVFHGQHNPRPDFDGMDDCGWFGGVGRLCLRATRAVASHSRP
jgi:hypothetical protein